MDFKKVIPILGLALLILLISSTVSASDIDDAVLNSSSSGMELTVDQSYEKGSIESSNLENNLNSIENDIGYNSIETIASNDYNGYNDDIKDNNYNNDLIYDKDNYNNAKSDLKASKLESVYTITQGDYSTYFDNEGNLLSNVNAGDTLLSLDNISDSANQYKQFKD